MLLGMMCRGRRTPVYVDAKPIGFTARTSMEGPPMAHGADHAPSTVPRADLARAAGFEVCRDGGGCHR